ncbi:uncharacterized protein PHACADRAFT_179655 [Phanerochaete carnosa HHB-10118-sp]|uniref:F-box domain-containing protein n=1 Tax=Phanerochaete carnosa (strain HHB-10118-sp) TaxID=650164 RepID=K5XBI7_PHACS|nr:uncharacterized protein PHACADRAFT_179655 [Phanerochaete carnosa HHB-10118-sp]EKM60302.1 hypothetical protein PHACADRAFT_179655 [Phanerochaete carnosa HHB-10118-sp]
MSLSRLRTRFFRPQTAITVANAESTSGSADALSSGLALEPPYEEHHSPAIETAPRENGYSVCSTLSFPIDRLAPELLAKVSYWFILDLCASSLEDYGFCTTLYPWLTIRHVCRAWRDVALTFPKLSTHIWLTQLECVADMIAISGTLPLHIYIAPSIRIDAAMEAEMFQVVLSHIERVAHAVLVLTEGSFPAGNSDTQPKERTIRALRLQSLDLHMFQSWVPSWPLFSAIDFPALRELTCTHASIGTLRSLIAPRLCYLHLVQCGLLVAGELLPSLRQLGELEELKLDRALRCSDESHPALDILMLHPNSHNSVTLSHLRKISIKDACADEVFLLLHRLSFPLSASVALQASGLVRSPISCDSYVAIMLAKMEGLDFKTLSLSTTIELGVTFHLWDDRLAADSDGEPSQLSSGEGARFSCSLRTPRRSFMTPLVQELPLAQIECAFLSEQAVGLDDAVPWAAILSLCHQWRISQCGMKLLITSQATLVCTVSNLQTPACCALL